MTSPPSPPSRRELRARLDGLMIHDRHRLRRRVEQAGTNGAATLLADIERAEARVANRRAIVPAITYPEALPVSERRTEILDAIREHQVLIVAGETGSGKSTQLPKLCLEAGQGVLGLVGHTQPRRLAARTIAERVAEEMGAEVGGVVGYAVRFTDKVGDRTLVKVMTDGILLAEIQRDRLLTRYDTIIVDEAHERSLNIDFILGYLRQLLPRRPDLKVIITSATLDTERFSQHFGDAPVVAVTGRTYPVEVRYRPLVDDGPDGDRDQIQAVGDAVRELCREGPGDILVFLSGEREIRDTADAIAKLELRDTEVVPLYARLSAAEQHRVFQPHTGRRVVLATNVAETSLTVPGIRYVVDPGTARISRYSRRTKVQRLPIESVSQASANQRAGRCGRVAPGVCIRLYSEDNFDSRPEFTEPEILRTNLASVILQMTAIGLGDLAAFPFVEPPDQRNIDDGIALLSELGALDPDSPRDRRRLTPIGRRLAQLPLDPRLGRMVLEAEQNGCLREVLVIAAALAIQDPRERPVGKREAAAEMHRRFADPDSDFVAFLNLWQYLREQQQLRNSSQFRKLCRTEFLNYLRVREWQDVHGQLIDITRSMGFRRNDEPGDRDRIHMSLLAGLLSHIGQRDGERREYIGARDARFSLSPGSGLFAASPRWVMAAELVETNRLWAHVAARIQPEWAERVGDHLLRRTYSEPHWDGRRGTTMAYERVTLYGVPIVAKRRVDYARVDAELAREMFIRHALVDGDWDGGHHQFAVRNAALLDQVEALEDRVRRRDLLVEEHALEEFFVARIPDDITSTRRFDRWWRDTKFSDPDQLTYSFDVLIDPGAGRIRLADFPDEWEQGSLRLPLSYVFDLDSPVDGASVRIPVAILNQVRRAGFDWHITGRRRNLVAALLRSLPKTLRRNFIPAAEHVDAFLAQHGPDEGPLLDVLAAFLSKRAGVAVVPGDWDLEELPGDLRITFVIVGQDGHPIAAGKDLDALARRLGGEMQEAVAAAAPTIECGGLRGWTFASELPRHIETTVGKHIVKGFPALVDEGDTVAVRILRSAEDQHDAMWRGTRRLLRLTVPPPAKALQRLLTNHTKLALGAGPAGSAGAVLDDAITAAIDALLASSGGPVWIRSAFDDLRAAVDTGLLDALLEAVPVIADICAETAGVAASLRGAGAGALAAAVADMRGQLDNLVFPGFVTAAGLDRMPDVLRYVQGIDRRLAKLAAEPARDRDQMRRIHRLQAEFEAALQPFADDELPYEAAEIHWMIEELRISFFAQQLGTRGKVSEKRILGAIADLAHGAGRAGSLSGQ